MSFQLRQASVRILWKSNSGVPTFYSHHHKCSYTCGRRTRDLVKAAVFVSAEGAPVIRIPAFHLSLYLHLQPPKKPAGAYL